MPGMTRNKFFVFIFSIAITSALNFVVSGDYIVEPFANIMIHTLTTLGVYYTVIDLLSE